MRATRLSVANYNTTLSSDSLESGAGSSNSLRSAGHSRVAQPLGFCPHRSERTDFPYSALLEVYPDFSRRPPSSGGHHTGGISNANTPESLADATGSRSRA